MACLLRIRCAAALSPPLAAPRQRHFFALTARLASAQSAEAFGLKPLRAVVTRSIGSARQAKAAAQPAEGDSRPQFPRPSSVGYDKSLANTIHLIGSVGVNPDIKYLDNGTIVATSSLSVKKAPQGDPSWFFLEFQNDLAEIAAQHVRKGDRIHVGGRVLVEKMDPNTGEGPQVLWKVEVSDLHFVDDLYGSKAQPLPTATAIKPGPTEKKLAAEKSWKLFFSSPSDWYDNRDNKRNPKAPDFKHKSNGEGLWIDGYYTPSFVTQQIADLEAKGVLKSSKPTPASTTAATTEEESSGYNPW
ncbi:protein OSB3, chloroplastic/mitochondrial-like isoform X2 [Selaginella moellendorffii]|uniref:protein OSB3, chloroplastic/mitochondrial-like isoform X2 n=1 Tax=Selaginella moellendorffii TaxID=88036 RepID=UPI000D1CFB0F|nr:protein OSB3, chloroplastic/mitochondrial-like isoform X2 [Selaginella moellendorffii]|eukprot:XP_024544073.1 protein OSB3, chloroplastic/mitochondrial-like isoform X2 [Selaginella moellendorffii]